METFKTIDDLITKLEEFKESFGNIPILYQDIAQRV